MCMFCAAIPTTLALGMTVKNNQLQKKIKAESEGSPLPRPKIRPKPITAAAIAGLMVCSIITHTSLQG